jgi:hypothetical protein
MLGILLALAALAPVVAAADMLPAVPPPLPAPRPLPRVRVQAEPTAWQRSLEAAPYYAPFVLAAFLIPLVLTLVVEVPVIAIAGRGAKAAWKAGFLVNMLTNPVAVFLVVIVLTPLVGLRSPPHATTVIVLGTALIELGVLLSEWRLLKWILGWTSRRAFLTALIANGASFGVGILLLWLPASGFLFGW